MPRTSPKRTPFSDFHLDYTPLARRRRYLGMTQQQLGRAIGVHKGTIWRTENHQSEPSYTQMLAIAKALGTPIHQLVEVVDGPLSDINGRP